MECGRYDQRSLSKSFTQTVPLLAGRRSLELLVQTIVPTPFKGMKMPFYER